MGNPLINELLVGTGFKDRFSMDQPKNDSQFASFFLDPALARVVNALTAGAVAIPAPPRVDLLPVVTYAPPIAAAGTPAGPVADLLRLNTGVAPTPPLSASRLGLLGGDPAGFPNGRRVFDDVTDLALRLVVGGVLAGPPFSLSPLNTKLGDGVNVNDAPYRTEFPYLANAPSGRTRRHVDPGEPACTPLFAAGQRACRKGPAEAGRSSMRSCVRGVALIACAVSAVLAQTTSPAEQKHRRQSGHRHESRQARRL